MRLSAQLRARDAELAEALEQQAATAEILRVISSSPTDVQPVFDAIAESASRLCGTDDVYIRRIDGDTTRRVAHVGTTPLDTEGDVRPLRLRTIAAAVARECKTIHIPDVTEPHVGERYPESLTLPGRWGVRTLLYVRLIREAAAIGMIVMRRREVRPFTDKQIELLETFAAQAVIAIENVRLFNETKEALEQQTVTSEILRVISSSPTDVQPVFEAIVKSGVHLFRGLNVVLRLVRGDHIEQVASTLPRDVDDDVPFEVSDRFPSSRAILHREVIQVPDVFAEQELHERVRRRAEQLGYRAVLAAPMLREDMAIGALTVTRALPGPFTDKQIALLKTFAAQAVIAIENVRLFNETKEALEQQTVISEILRVISSSPTDTQPVFDAIVKSGVHLFGGMNVSLNLVRGDRIETVAGTLPLRGAGFENPARLG